MPLVFQEKNKEEDLKILEANLVLCGFLFIIKGGSGIKDSSGFIYPEFQSLSIENAIGQETISACVTVLSFQLHNLGSRGMLEEEGLRPSEAALLQLLELCESNKYCIHLEQYRHFKIKIIQLDQHSKSLLLSLAYRK